MANRFVGSPDIYAQEGREAEQSVNFITCHDGFTLNDLVSYNSKHNKENGEDNRDGSNDNRSWNCGAEGQSNDSEIERLRNRQIKNFLAVTLLSLGVPMILMGDEMRRTQRGNNNPYCQDNEISWLDWTLVDRHPDLLRFVRLLTQRRVQRDLTPERERRSLDELIRGAKKAWHGVKRYQPDCSENSHSLAFSTEMQDERLAVFFILNAYWEALQFELPPADEQLNTPWRRWIDTSLETPDDICDWQAAAIVRNGTYTAGPRSLVVLYAQLEQRAVPMIDVRL